MWNFPGELCEIQFFGKLCEKDFMITGMNFFYVPNFEEVEGGILVWARSSVRLRPFICPLRLLLVVKLEYKK